MMRLGTGAIEIKSGYGLDGIKMLRVIKQLAQTYPISIKATFLGNAIPLEYRDRKAI
jgi:imidazolonepropionase